MGRIIAENKHTGKLYPVDSKAIYRVIYEVVAVLPTENIKTSVIYCVPIIGKENEYDMFLYINEVWVPTGGGDNQLYIIDVTQPVGVHPYTDFYAPSDISLGDICNIAKEMQVVVRFNGLHTDFYGRKFEKTVYWTILCSGQKQQSGAKYFITYIDPTGRIRTLDGIYERHPVVFKWDGTLEDYAESLVENKMDLAPLNPTAEQIAALPSGQLYSDTANHKGVIKGGQSFYDSVYIDENTYTKTEIDNIIGAISTLSFEVVQSKPVSDIKTNVIYLVPKSTAETNNVYEEWIYVNNAWELIGTTEVDLNNYYTKTEVNNNFLTGKSRSSAPPRKGSYLSQKLWCDYYDGSLYALSHQNRISDDEYEYEWVLISNVVFSNVAPPTSKKANFPSNVSPYQVGYIWVHGNRNADIFTSLIDVYFCTSSTTRKVGNDIWYDYTWVNLSQNFYTKGEVNTLLAVKENSSNKITSLSSSSTDTQYPSAKCVYDSIPTNISAFTNDSGYLTLETLPIYDGTVI